MAQSTSRIKDLYGDAMDLPASEREAFVRGAAPDEPEVVERVLALLAASSHAGEMLGEPKGGALHRVVASAAAVLGKPVPLPGEGGLIEPPGTVLGRYRLERIIGEGGFGVVYLASQREPVKREVALKILKPGMDTRAVLARFRAEQEALSLMDHPGIARVLDAGATPNGRPYVVMELIRSCSGGGPEARSGEGPAGVGVGVEGVGGEPITAAADRLKLTVRERVELMVLVCRAVEHAHGKGVIHRDIKPSNVLVTLVDGKPKPKVIDFGIAKATTPGVLSSGVTELAAGQALGTPAHMAPEQLDGSRPIDVRTDVYGLGSLMYELLVGGSPLQGSQTSTGSIEALRHAVLHVEPPTLDRRITTLAAEEQSSVAASRGAQPRALASALRGELSWIVGRTLRKDPAERYQTVAALGDELQRWLARMPIEAGPPTASYRFRKWFSRNRTRAVAIIAVVLAGVAGLVSTSIGFYVASKQRSLAEAKETEAIRQAGRAATVTRFLLDDMIGSLTPEANRSRDITVREIAEIATARMGKRFEPTDESRIAVQAALADMWTRIGESARGVELYEEALRLAEARYGPSSPELLPLLMGLINALEASGSHAYQFELLGRLTAIARVHLPESDPLRLNAELVLTRTLHTQHRDTEAREVLNRVRMLIPPGTNLELQAMVAEGYITVNETERAAIMVRALELAEQLHSPVSPEVYRVLANLSRAQIGTGQLEEAEATARRALAVAEQLFSPQSTQASESLHALGEVLTRLGRVVEGADFEFQAASSAAVTLGPEHRMSRTLLADAIQAAMDAGLIGRAVEASERLMAIERRVGGPDAEGTLSAQRRHIRVLISADRTAEAVAWGQDGVERADRLGGGWQIGLRRAYADALLAAGDINAAEATFEEAARFTGRLAADRLGEVLAAARNSFTRLGYPDRAARFEDPSRFLPPTAPAPAAPPAPRR